MFQTTNQDQWVLLPPFISHSEVINHCSTAGAQDEAWGTLWKTGGCYRPAMSIGEQVSKNKCNINILSMNCVTIKLVYKLHGRRLIDDRLLFQPPLVDFAWFLPVVLSIAAFFDSSKSSFELLAFFISCFTFPSRCLSFISGFESTSYTHLWEKKT